VTFVPWGRTWRIADMRLMQEGIPPEFKVAQGPAGTLRILSAPEEQSRPTYRCPSESPRTRDAQPH
jgi:hypothetical protein